MTNDTTHFGFQTVRTTEKKEKVAAVFKSVSSKYDLMNDLMSLGLHRLWKDLAVKICQVRTGDVVLDLAGGTGDLSFQLSQRVGKTGKIFLTDINHAMLGEGRNRLMDRGAFRSVEFIQADAEQLPFPDNTFDRIIIGFGLRNVTNKNRALQSMYQALKPGGFLLILEFSTPTSPLLKKAYDAYSFNVIPRLGHWIANDEESYRYLVESIRMHPDQETLINMMQEALFEDCQYQNLSGGIVAVHKGYKY